MSRMMNPFENMNFKEEDWDTSNINSVPKNWFDIRLHDTWFISYPILNPYFEKQFRKRIPEEYEIERFVYILYYEGEVWDIFSTPEKAFAAARNLIEETYYDGDSSTVDKVLERFEESKKSPCGCFDSFGDIIAKVDNIIVSKYIVDPK